MSFKPLAAVALTAGLLGLGAVAPAQAESDVSILAGTCANCHGTDGRSPGSIPSIAGQPYAVLLAQLNAFKAGEIVGATVMTRLARGYTDEEIEALARYFSEQQP